MSKIKYHKYILSLPPLKQENIYIYWTQIQTNTS